MIRFFAAFLVAGTVAAAESPVAPASSGLCPPPKHLNCAQIVALDKARHCSPAPPPCPNAPPCPQAPSCPSCASCCGECPPAAPCVTKACPKCPAIPKQPVPRGTPIFAASAGYLDGPTLGVGAGYRFAKGIEVFAGPAWHHGHDAGSVSQACSYPDSAAYWPRICHDLVAPSSHESNWGASVTVVFPLRK